MINRSILLMFMSILVACSSSSQKSIPQKFDAPLSQKIKQVEKSGSGEEIKIFGKCREGITSEMRNSIEGTNVQVESVIGDIFTGTGTPAALRDLARLDFVTQIQLATISKPL